MRAEDIDGERVLDIRQAPEFAAGHIVLDVARILLQDPAELARTDIADRALAPLRASTVREVVVLGRRGPARSSFSAQELRVHAIGYRGEPIPGLPFDESRGTYVAGWIKRGAGGLIGMNRGCAKNTVEALLEDAGAGRLTTAGTLSAEEVAERVGVVVSHRGWQALDAHERGLGKPAGRPRVKMTGMADMLDVAGHR